MIDPKTTVPFIIPRRLADLLHRPMHGRHERSLITNLRNIDDHFRQPILDEIVSIRMLPKSQRIVPFGVKSIRHHSLPILLGRFQRPKLQSWNTDARLRKEWMSSIPFPTNEMNQLSFLLQAGRRLGQRNPFLLRKIGFCMEFLLFPFPICILFTRSMVVSQKFIGINEHGIRPIHLTHPNQAFLIEHFLSHSMTIPFDFELIFIGNLIPSNVFAHEMKIVPFFDDHMIILLATVFIQY
mmetsp:Transcript_4602/g.13252  ORF Transcript_4602/g.13252 Transcript_4602/m.13252 type:complete len:239 (-) Transcript_4602:451-1167(-)